jgi:hypothetical protein
MYSSPNVVPQTSKRVAHDLAQRGTVDPIVQDKSLVCWSRGVASFRVFSSTIQAGGMFRRPCAP